MTEAAFDIRDFLPYLLTQAAEESSLSFQRQYRARHGILRSEWRVIFHLGRYGRLTAGEIGTRARLHKTKVSRAVAKLEGRRLLSRSPDPADGRREWLELTPAGRQVFGELEGLARDHQARLLAPFSAEERDTLGRCLKQLAQL